jgi:hypothetical protein
MPRASAVLALLCLLLGACGHAPEPSDTPGEVTAAQTQAALETLRPDRRLNTICTEVASLMATRFADQGLAPGAIGVAVICGGRRPEFGQFNGHVAFDPGELAALPLAIEAMRQRAEGLLTEHQVTSPMTRALREGDTDGINTMIDLLTSTQSGPTIIGPSLDRFLDARQGINRGLQTLGLYGMGVGHHQTRGLLSGREAQAAVSPVPGANRMTPLSTARALWLLAAGRVISEARSAIVVDAMRRPAGPAAINDRLPEIPEGATAHGLAGWLGAANHGAWIIQADDDPPVIIAVFIRWEGGSPDAPSGIASGVFSRL